jgi:hypothetical protein
MTTTQYDTAAVLRERAAILRKEWRITDTVTPQHLELAAGEIDKLLFALAELTADVKILAQAWAGNYEHEDEIDVVAERYYPGKTGDAMSISASAADTKNDEFSAIIIALAWSRNHPDHVNDLIRQGLKRLQVGVKPSGSDLHNPALWKDIHWLWLREQL